MDLIPRRRLDEITSFRKEMESLFNRFFSEVPLLRRFKEEWLPMVDFSETKDKLVFKAELPGLEAKDIEVTVSGDILTIKGEKKREQEEEDEHYHAVERYYGSFQRSFSLPPKVKADKIEAKFTNGVLRITLPKTEEAKKKVIDVKVE
jgi:HSP20 family protein